MTVLTLFERGSRYGRKGDERQRGPGELGIAGSPRGGWREGDGVLLRIFTQNIIGPIFFEIIQRKGSELDQMWRGVLWHRAFAG